MKPSAEPLTALDLPQEPEESISDPSAQIEMALRIDRARQLLPAWFVPRMMDDHWSFGLLLVTGQTIGIESIHAVHQAADGAIWLDVAMLSGDLLTKDACPDMFTPPCSRLTASINAAHVVAAFELADT